MKKIELGQTIQILANLGVVAGIVFLGYELRQNTRAIASAASQGVQDAVIAGNALAMDESMAAIVMKAGMDGTELSPLEAHRFGTYRLTALHNYQNVYFQMRNGTYPAEQAEGWWRLMRNNFEVPIMRAHWESWKYTVSEDFQKFVETYVMALEPTVGATTTAAFPRGAKIEDE